MEEKKNFLVVISIISRVGAILCPLLGVWFPQIREIIDWAGYTVIMIFSIKLLGNQKNRIG